MTWTEEYKPSVDLTCGHKSFILHCDVCLAAYTHGDAIKADSISSPVKTAKWTKDSVKTWVKDADVNNTTHRAALSRALLFLYSRQTADEQESQHTAHNNGMGFSGIDAEFLSSVAQGIIKYGSMTPKQAVHVQRRLVRYSGQLLLMIESK